jgi:hypothetical protein
MVPRAHAYTDKLDNKAGGLGIPVWRFGVGT